jgi:hypothetical protein
MAIVRKKKLSFSQFVEKSIEKFGEGAFDYSKTVMNGMRTPITLICVKHGEFQTAPNYHLVNPCGCLQCSKENRGKKSALAKLSADSAKVDLVWALNLISGHTKQKPPKPKV